MNENIVRALLELKREKGDGILTDCGLLRAAEPKPGETLPPPKSSSRRPSPVAGPTSSGFPGKVWTNSIDMEFVLIPSGTFLMGDPELEPPRHKVRISRPFYLGRYPVTQGQWEAVIRRNPSQFKGPRLPVENVSWQDAQNFIRKLNAKERHNRYRLPTEAEWEYAARAGSTTQYFFGDDASRLDRYAWFAGNACGQTHPVGQKQANPWGLYDMYGNVWEWCADWFAAYQLEALRRNMRDSGQSGLEDWRSWWSGLGRTPQTLQTWWETNYGGNVAVDPQGPKAGVSRVFRGGCWSYVAGLCRSAARDRCVPGGRYDDGGFRLALSPGP